ncbi:MAG: hypothetical protein ACE5IH_00260, partial [Thermodesulfobacteriota bacterium]
GVFSFAGEVYRGTHKPLITKALYDRAQEVMKERAKPNRKGKRDFTFSGECGAMITAEVQKGHIIAWERLLKNQILRPKGNS